MNSALKSLAKAHALSILLPAVAWLSLSALQSAWDLRWKEQVRSTLQSEYRGSTPGSAELSVFTPSVLCGETTHFPRSPAMTEACDRLGLVQKLQRWTVYAMAGGTALAIVLLLLAVAARMSPLTPLWTFSAARATTPFVVSLLALIGPALLLSAFYYVERFLWGQLPVFVYGILGVALSYWAARATLWSLFLFASAERSGFGKLAQPLHHPRLNGALREVSKRTGVPVADHLVLGFGPRTFFAPKVLNTLDGRLEGSTLFLSLPVSRVLTQDELKVLLLREAMLSARDRAHREGGLCEEYDQLAHRQRQLENHLSNHWMMAPSLVPALVFSRALLTLFYSPIRALVRYRTLSADRFAAHAYGPLTVARSVLKADLCQRAWGRIQGEMSAFRKQGKAIRNLSEFFAAAMELPEQKEEVERLDSLYPELPWSTNVSWTERLAALGNANAAKLWPTTRVPPGPLSGAGLVDSVAFWEESLTDLETVPWSRPLKHRPPLQLDNDPAQDRERDTGT